MDSKFCYLNSILRLWFEWAHMGTWTERKMGTCMIKLVKIKHIGYLNLYKNKHQEGSSILNVLIMKRECTDIVERWSYPLKRSIFTIYILPRESKNYHSITK